MATTSASRTDRSLPFDTSSTVQKLGAFLLTYPEIPGLSFLSASTIHRKTASIKSEVDYLAISTTDLP